MKKGDSEESPFPAAKRPMPCHAPPSRTLPDRNMPYHMMLSHRLTPCAQDARRCVAAHTPSYPAKADRAVPYITLPGHMMTIAIGKPTQRMGDPLFTAVAYPVLPGCEESIYR